MIINDLLGVIYAPQKAFKKIVENPKYLGVIIIIVLFLAVQTSYYASFYSKVYYEQTAPASNNLSAFTTTNSTDWVINSGGIVSQNYQDFINQTFTGNSSLQLNMVNGKNLTAVLNNFGFSVDCSDNSFKNLSLKIKQVEPNTLPQKAALTLYTANGTTSYFQYDFTSMLSSGTINEWNNLTLPIGTPEWQNIGSANWSDVTGIKLEFNYPTASNITIRIDGLFFRGLYLTIIDAAGFTWFAIMAIESVVMQFLFQWIIFTAVLYLMLKGLNTTNLTWKPLFVATGYVLIVLVMVALFGLISTAALPTVYYPYEFPPSASLIYSDIYISSASAQSQAIYNTIASQVGVYTTTSTVLTILLYVWQVVLATFAIRAVANTTWPKSIGTAIGGVILTVIIIGILSGLGFL